MPIPARIIERVETFGRNLESYLSPDYKATQLRRYSYSGKLPLGIVTDFHEFAIYDTRLRPHENDTASTGRIFYCTFDQYPEKWDEIAAVFSREAVLRGSFDKHAAGLAHRARRFFVHSPRHRRRWIASPAAGRN